MSQESERSAAARRELQNTLDAIEDKLNVPKRFGEFKDFAEQSWQRNPLPWLIGAAVAVVAVGAIVVSLFSDDD